MSIQAKIGSDSDPDRKHLFLIGFSGSGKSSVGPILARLMRRRFVDLDSLIARSQRMRIADIFRLKGERYFRALERQILERELSSSRKRLVIALGGGAYQDGAIRSRALRSGVVVFLSCAKSEIYRRLKDRTDRPLLNVRPRSGQTVRQARLEKIAQMLTARRANYRRADMIVSTTNRTPEKAALRIIELSGNEI
jgi:shikimate kinase